MNLSEFIHSKLKDIANTYPITAPMKSELPFITYGMDGQQQTTVISGDSVSQNFVTITVYAEEYDEADALSKQIRDVMLCMTEQNIIGVTFASMSNGFDGEPVDRYNVTLEFNIYER